MYLRIPDRFVDRRGDVIQADGREPVGRLLWRNHVRVQSDERTRGIDAFILHSFRGLCKPRCPADYIVLFRCGRLLLLLVLRYHIRFCFHRNAWW